MANEPIVTIIGNLVAEPELRMSQAGKPWLTFRMANTPRTKNRDTNEWEDGETMWISCRAFGTYAENIAASLHKGQQVIVQGRLSYRTYTNKDGVAGHSIELEVDECGPTLRFAVANVQKSQGGGGGGAGSAASYYGQAPAQAAADPWGAPAQQPQAAWPAQPQAQAAWGQPAVPQQQQQQQAPPQQQAQQQQQQQWPTHPPQQQFSGFDDEKPF